MQGRSTQTRGSWGRFIQNLSEVKNTWVSISHGFLQLLEFQIWNKILLAIEFGHGPAAAGCVISC